MKSDTQTILGIRSVGDGDAKPIIESMTTIEAVKTIARFVVESTMTKRFQFCMARSRDEVMVGLGLSKSNRKAQLREKAERASDFIDSLFDAPAGGQSTDTETNTDSESNS